MRPSYMLSKQLSSWGDITISPLIARITSCEKAASGLRGLRALWWTIWSVCWKRESDREVVGHSADEPPPQKKMRAQHPMHTTNTKGNRQRTGEWQVQ